MRNKLISACLLASLVACSEQSAKFQQGMPEGAAKSLSSQDALSQQDADNLTSSEAEYASEENSVPPSEDAQAIPADNAASSEQSLAIAVTVPSNQIRSGSSAMQASAKVSGTEGQVGITWSVQAPAGKAAGSISDTGLYTPPATGGEYEVIISASVADQPQIKNSVVIKIVTSDAIFVGCQSANQLFPITALVYKLPENSNRLPDFNAIGAKLTTVCMDQYAVSPRNWSEGFPGLSGLFEWFALQTTTKISIPTSGNYTFRLNSDDGAKLYVDGQLVVDNDGQHAPTAKDGSMVLTAGEHTVRLDYFQGPRYQIALELLWRKPGTTSYELVPKSAFK